MSLTRGEAYGVLELPVGKWKFAVFGFKMFLQSRLNEIWSSTAEYFQLTFSPDFENSRSAFRLSVSY